MTQRSLTDYDNPTDTPVTPSDTDTNTDTEPVTEHDSSTESDTPSIDHESLPNTAHWATETHTHHDATLIRAKNSEFLTFPGDTTLRTDHVQYVINGLSEYLAATNGRSITPPETYRELREEFTPRITGESCLSDTGYIGITRDRLEAGIRLAVDGGRYSSNDLNIYTAGPLGFILSYNDHTYLIETEAIHPDDTTHTVNLTFNDGRDPIHGYDINEDHPVKRRELKTLLPAIDAHTEITINAYDGLTGSSHQFRTEDNTRLLISKSELRKLPETLMTLDEITGKHTLTPDIGSEQSFTIPGVPAEPGTEHRFGGTVIGYDYTYRNQSSGAYSSIGASSITRIGDNATASLHTYTARLTEQDTRTDRDPTVRLRISNNDVRVAKYTIKNGKFTTMNQYRTRLDRD